MRISNFFKAKQAIKLIVLRFKVLLNGSLTYSRIVNFLLYASLSKVDSSHSSAVACSASKRGDQNLLNIIADEE